MVNELSNAVPKEVQATLYNSTVTESAFLKASKSLGNVTPGGVVTWSAANGNARVVEEGKPKPINEDAKAVEIRTDAIAIFDLFSSHVEGAITEVVDNLKNQAGNNFALELDKTIAQVEGRYDATARDNGIFKAMSGVETVTVDTADPTASVIEALSGAGQDGAPSSFVMSTSLLYTLLSIREVGIGSVFAGLENAQAPTLMGLPVYTFASPDKVGYVGSFSSQAAGGISVPSDGLIRVFDDFELAKKNQRAYRTEVWAAYAISDPKYFRKLEIAEG